MKIKFNDRVKIKNKNFINFFGEITGYVIDFGDTYFKDERYYLVEYEIPTRNRLNKIKQQEFKEEDLEIIK